MATQTNLGVGGIIGGAVGLVIVGALVASPLYLGALQRESRQLDASTADPIERVRRAILNLDESLASIADAHSAALAGLKLESSRIAELSKIKGLVSPDLTKSMDDSAAALRDLETKDEARGTKIEGGKVAAGALPFGSAPNEMKSKYIGAHKKLLADADKAMLALNNANHLGSTRIRAILEYSRGRIERNRASFEAWEADVYRRQAVSLVESVSFLQRSARALIAESPDEVIKKLTMQIADEKVEIDGLKNAVTAISQAVAEAEGKIGELEEQATAARRRMVELESQDAAIHDENGEYAKLSRDAREAEAAADSMRNGTLSDANRVAPQPGGDMIETAYEGGSQHLGIRDLKDRLEQRQEQLAGREKMQAALTSRKTDLIKQNDELKAKAKAASNLADEQLALIDDLLQKSESHHKAADQAAVNAVKALTEAVNKATSASRAAATRQQELLVPDQDANELDTERNTLIRGDKDSKAAIDCIAAESNYLIALTQADQMDWIRSNYETLKDIAARTGRDGPGEIASELDALRTKATAKAGESRKKYEEIAKAIAQSAAAPGSTVSGKDMVWQVQMGEASARLMLAALATSDDERRTEQNAAYDLLKSIIEKREQSPAVDAAIQSFLLLQETAQ